MMKTLWNTWQTEIRYGLLVVGVTLLWMVGENILITVYQQPSWGNITGALAVLIPITGYWLMLSQQAKEHKGLSWKSAFQSGTAMTLTVAIVGATMVALYAWLVPQPIELYLDYLRQQYEQTDLSPGEVSLALSTAAGYFQPQVQALATVIGSIITGLVLPAAMTPMIQWRTKHHD